MPTTYRLGNSSFSKSADVEDIFEIVVSAQSKTSELLIQSIRILPNAEFQLPAIGGFRALAPQLKDAKFGNVAMEPNRDKIIFDGVVFGKVRLQRVSLG